MQIAICDDDAAEISQISSLLDHYKRKKGASVTYKTFQSATELLSTMKTLEYDLFLLDICMPGINGLQAAAEIRQSNEDVKIIFLTASPDFALDSYAVKAHNYLLKPLSMDRLFTILDTLLADEQKPREGLTLKTQTGITRILFSKLVFVEVMNKKLCFYLTDGCVRFVTASLSKFENQLLCRPEFIKTHRSYIVNLWQISEITSKELITHTGKTIPISRLLYTSVRKAYMEHLFVEKRCRDDI